MSKSRITSKLFFIIKPQSYEKVCSSKCFEALLDYTYLCHLTRTIVGASNSHRVGAEKTMVRRKIVLEIAYFGLTYQGLARQKNHKNTVTSVLLRALVEAGMVSDESETEIVFVGRTDKGVSAAKNACSLFVDSPLQPLEKYPLCKIVNSKLPPNVRTTRWASVPDNFNARFACVGRSYKYYLADSAADQRHNNRFDLDKASLALHSLLGRHDFRNLCKVDFRNCLSYEREVVEAKIERVGSLVLDKTTEFFEISVSANGFLWHMVRNIVAVVAAVGRGLEGPEVFGDLLDVAKVRRKPQIAMAPGAWLVLSDYRFAELLDWKDVVPFHVERKLTENLLTNFIWGCLAQSRLASHSDNRFCPDTSKQTNYIKLLDRPTSETGFRQKKTKFLLKRLDCV